MSKLGQLLHSVRLVGVGSSLRAIRYAADRDRADGHLAPYPRTPVRTPGPAVAAAVVDGSVVVTFERAELELRWPRRGQVSLGWSGALDAPSYALSTPPETPGTMSVQLEETDTGWLATGDGIAVEIDRDGATRFLDAAGRMRRADGPPVWHGTGWALTLAPGPGATLHGLGGRSSGLRGGWDLAGGEYRCWNSDPGGAWLPGDDPLYVTTPVFATLDDHGAVHCLVDNTFGGTVDARGGRIVLDFEAGPLRLHVSVGSLGEVLSAYAGLTGHPAAPPRWALGHHQARWGYGSGEAVREVQRGFADRGLPLSAIHVDIDHMERFRNFSFGAAWPDPAGLVADLARHDVRLVVIVDAGIARDDDYATYRDGLRTDRFCRDADGEVFEGEVWPGSTVFPDFTDPGTRDWWGEQLAFYTELGVAGFWHDMNEPSCFSAWGDPTFPRSTRHQLDGAVGDHREAHNVYGMQMARASYEGLRRLQPDTRPFLFSRSGWAGLQRYGGHWSGDVEASWGSLRASLTQCLGYGVSGVPYYGPDIGGFTGDPSPELFTRWFQLASFLPLFRTHCAWNVPRREPWEWGEEVLGRLRGALLRRYRLLPLWYSLALESARTGAPYVRPLGWVDPTLRDIDDEFLLGDDVLVAPVLEEGAVRRTVRLPAGEWWQPDAGTRHSGTFVLPVGPDDTPWFVRAGAVVPTEEDGRLVLLVAPPTPGVPAPGGRLLTDAGDGWAAPHEEAYTVAAEEGALVVTRHVVHPGDFGFTEVDVHALDGRPTRLQD